MTGHAPAHAPMSRDDRAVMLRLSGIRKRFGEKEVLRGVDFEVRQGEHVVIFGPSGSGKSTLLRTANLLEQPNEGSILMSGVEYGPAPRPPGVRQGSSVRLRRSVGMVFQQFNLFPHMTAVENIAFALRRVKRMRRAEAEERAVNGLDEVGLRPWAAHYPSQLSGGQQQRVAIARALSLDPAVMLFDEPTSALDVELVGDVLAVMRRLAEAGMTMVIVTHELKFARDIGDFNVYMENGEIVETGSRDIYDHPRDPRTQRFLKAVL